MRYDLTPESFAIILGVGAFAFGSWGTHLIRRARATRRWKPAEGHITWSHIEEIRRRGRYGERVVGYKPDIQYKYRIGENEHQGTRLWFGYDHRMSEANARAIATRYSVGTRLRVFYDPADVTETVVERGHEEAAWKTIKFAVLMAIGAIGTAVYLAAT
jgi:hypothetical protein